MRKRTIPSPGAAATPEPDSAMPGGTSRREFLKSTGGVAAAAAVPATLSGATAGAAAASGHGKPRVTVRDPKRKVLRGGIVLTLETTDYEKADVVVEGKKIVAIGPNAGDRAGGQHIDCRGMIVMPGFISTHNHQYEAIQRSIIPDGIIVFAGDSDQQRTDTTDSLYEAYGTVVQGIWTQGRIGSATAPQWDIGRSPSDPEDNYNAELIACLSQITQGITCGTDTSQASHTPEHTDAMIEGCMASGRRTLYDYTNGTNRDSPAGQYKQPYGQRTSPNEYPVPGLPRIAEKYFSSKDELVTLAFAGGPTVIPNLPAPYTGLTGWKLAREFGAWINNHNVGNANVPQQGLDNGNAPFDDVTLVHCVRWQDNSIAQLSYGDQAYPASGESSAWEIWSENGGHVSIAVLIEEQMRHGMPPIQQALNHGILPSLSPDVDTNMTADPFSMMRGAFTIQRALANDLAFSTVSDPGNLPIPQLVTSRQCVEMMTVAGAAASGLLNKVGTLEVGKEADIVMLDYNNINFQPMNNVYGTIVTMMDTRAVRHVMIAGKMVYRDGRLVGWDLDKVVAKAVASRDKALARIQGPAIGSDTDIINRGKNSFGHPYRPNFLGSCCYNGQNEFAPAYVLRP
jgi:5-methylthioadenosine/S-adenosylhomocysteine deaminase